MLAVILNSNVMNEGRIERFFSTQSHIEYFFISVAVWLHQSPVLLLSSVVSKDFQQHDINCMFSSALMVEEQFI